jgi:2-dehydro-3-deoxyphosphogluconate aldolase/(4S)-4-hydroxy-2-oxoglutarate aldolase
MSKKKRALDGIIAQGIMPLFYYPDTEVSIQVIRTLYRAGIKVLEYTNRAAGALENFKVIKQAQLQEMPDMLLGSGTIKSVEEAKAFIEAGADFIVAPTTNPEVAKITADHDLLWIPGCMTPTEIFLAQQNNAALIKIFPANILGPGFINSIKELFPGQLFLPTGGVDLTKENITGWFNAGVCAVGMGSKLFSKEILDNRLYDQLYTNTINVCELIQAVNNKADRPK